MFVNLDPDAVPLESYLEILPEHLDWMKFEDRYIGAHVTQVVPCNWKVALEAFAEGYHMPETHYEHDPRRRRSAPNGFAAFTADSTIQYDVWPECRHIDRLILAIGRPSRTVLGQVEGRAGDLRRLVQGLLAAQSRPLEAGRDSPARRRPTRPASMFGLLFQRDLSGASDTDVLDQVQYNIFPNFTVWGTTGGPLCYRFRPHGDNPHESIFEVWFLYPQPEAAPRRCRRPRNGCWRRARRGRRPRNCRSTGRSSTRTCRTWPASSGACGPPGQAGNVLGSYQEIRIRHFHQTLESYLEPKPEEEAE